MILLRFCCRDREQHLGILQGRAIHTRRIHGAARRAYLTWGARTAYSLESENRREVVAVLRRTRRKQRPSNFRAVLSRVGYGASHCAP